MMSFNKRRMFIASDTSDDDDSFKRRRSSLRVNLSCENVTDSGNGSLCRPEIADKRETDTMQGNKRRLSRSKRNDTHKKSNQLSDFDNEGDLQIKDDTSKLVVNQDTNVPLHVEKGIKLKRLTVDLENISFKEKTLETNCKRLKDAILNKTKEIFDKELAKKTEMILKNEENLHDANIGNKSGIILDTNHQLRNKTILEHEKCTNIVSDQQRDNQYANIVTTPISSKFERPKKAIDKSRLIQRRLFAKEDKQIGQEKCRIIEDITLEKKFSILPLTQTDQSGSPILSGSNRRLGLVRARFKLHSQNQFENLNTTFSTIHSENVGAPIICSTFNEDIETDENKKNSPYSETNSDMDTSRATHTTNRVVSMEITEIHGGIRMSEKRLSLQRTNLSTNNSIENGKKKESKQENLEQTRCAIQVQRTENINSFVNKSTIQNNVSNFDSSNTSASNDQNTILPMQISSIEQMTVTKMQPQVHEHSNKTNNERRTVILSDSDDTIRSSLNVNTSLDAITKASKEENIRKTNDYRINNGNQNFKTKTNDEESVTLENQYEKSNTTEVSMKMNTSVNSMRERWQRRSTHQSLMSDKIEETTENNPNIDDQSSLAAENIEVNDVDSLENISLIQRLRNISTQNQAPYNNKLRVSKMKEKVTTDNRSDDTENEEANDEENISLIRRLRNISTRMDNKSNAKLQSSENTNGGSYVEATPYPISRSVLFRTQLKHKTQNLDSSTSDSSNLISINNKKNIDKTDNESNALCPETADTIISNGNSSVSQDQLRVIEETVNESKLETSEKSTVTTNNTECISVRRNRRKLLPLDDHSQLCSITPIEEVEESSPKKAKKEISRKKNIKSKKKHSRRISICLKNDTSSIKRNIAHEQTLDNDYDIFKNKKKKEKKIQKPRKVVSKKIVIKKFAEENTLNILKENKQDKRDELLDNRHSLDDFVKHRTIPTQWNKHKSQKIVIAVTGLSKGDKSLVKSIVKSLGKAEIELNVSRRTTHVVSTGVRTANLLRGIIRGCWLVTLEWVLKSLENNGWLHPEEFEMKHFSKAVQENRKDRQLFGVSYIPELFATCGLIYVGQTTLPCHTLKELVKTAGGHITDDIKLAKIIIDANGLKETWIIDSITTGELQLTKLYQRE